MLFLKKNYKIEIHYEIHLKKFLKEKNDFNQNSLLNGILFIKNTSKTKPSKERQSARENIIGKPWL